MSFQMSMKHPALVLIPLREHLLALMRAREVDHAKNIFIFAVKPMLESNSHYVPQDYIRDQVEYLESIVKCEACHRSCHYLDKRSILEQICDYMRLYFPDKIGYGDDVPEDSRANDLWRLAYIIKDSSGKPIYTNKKKRFRCLACGWEAGTNSGIGSLRFHFAATGRVSCCHMVTQNICDRLGIPLPPLKGKGKRTRESREIQARSYHHHPNPSVTSSLMTGQLGATLHQMTILDFRGNISQLLDQITDIIVLLNVGPVRKLLDKMKHACNKSRTPPCDGTISAIMMQKILKAIRREVDLLHKNVHNSIQGNISSDIFDLFEKLDEYIAEFDDICLKAIVESAVGSNASGAEREQEQVGVLPGPHHSPTDGMPSLPRNSSEAHNHEDPHDTQETADVTITGGTAGVGTQHANLLNTAGIQKNQSDNIMPGTGTSQYDDPIGFTDDDFDWLLSQDNQNASGFNASGAAREQEQVGVLPGPYHSPADGMPGLSRNWYVVVLLDILLTPSSYLPSLGDLCDLCYMHPCFGYSHCCLPSNCEAHNHEHLHDNAGGRSTLGDAADQTPQEVADVTVTDGTADADTQRAGLLNAAGTQSSQYPGDSSTEM